jgi:hypothetical protein
MVKKGHRPETGKDEIDSGLFESSDVAISSSYSAACDHG